MTNADKYLKEGVTPYEFAKAYFDWYFKIERKVLRIDKEIELFLQDTAQPTLTEDERVILRNIDKKYKYISRGKGETELYVRKEADETCSYIFRGYNHLFQFIKDGEEYEIKELLKGE